MTTDSVPKTTVQQRDGWSIGGMAKGAGMLAPSLATMLVVLTTDAVEASDVVITMGCGDACPVFPGKRYLDWQLTDPAGKGVDAVRPIRDEIDARVRDLLRELGVTPVESTLR